MSDMTFESETVNLTRRAFLGGLGVAVVVTALPSTALAEQMTRVIVTLRNRDRDREIQDLFNGLSGVEYRLVEAYQDQPVVILDVSGRAMNRLRDMPMVVNVAADGITPLPRGETPERGPRRPEPEPGRRPRPEPEPDWRRRPEPDWTTPRRRPELDQYLVQYFGRNSRREIRRIRAALDGVPYTITRHMPESRMIVIRTTQRGVRRLQRVEGIRVMRDGLSRPL